MKNSQNSGLPRVTRTDIDASLAEAERLWGPTDGRRALPQAAQLKARIAVCRAHIEAHPRDTKAKRDLGILQRLLAKVERDPADQKRCREWLAAYEQFTELLTKYNTQGPQQGQLL